MDRRTFLRMTIAASLALEHFPSWSWEGPKRSRVIYMTDPLLAKGKKTSSAGLRRMLDRSIMLLTGADKAEDAWRELISPDDTVGIKVNCLAGFGLSSNTLLVETIAKCLNRIGVTGERIIVWDRTDRDLRSAGFKTGSKSKLYRCFGTDEAGYDSKLYESGSIGSLISSILTDRCTAIINVPVLKDHGITGVSLSMKNYFGAIHNPNKYHPNAGNPYIADLNSMDIIRKKERLIICDCLRGQYNGGPAYNPKWNWAEGSILVSRDPVALDFTGFGIIERKREEMGLPGLRDENRYPQYIFSAEKINRLGFADPRRIELIREEV